MIAGLLAGACVSTSPEQQLLSRFFAASRVRDRTVLAGMASVVFEPASDGIVQEFQITNIGEEASTSESRVIKLVTIDAQVRSLDGQITPKTLIVTLEKADRRWVVVAIQ